MTDGIPGVAGGLLEDDFPTSGLVFKTEKKTTFGGTVLSSQWELFSKGCATPATLSWSWPTPFGIKQLGIDKLEVDKAGAFALEASTSEVYPGLTMSFGSDLADVNETVAGFTYTGLKDCEVKFGCKALNPQDFTKEVSYTKDIATFGLKLDSSILKGGKPDLGVALVKGPFFGSVVATDGLSTFNAHAHYKVNDDIECAATYQHGGEDNSAFAVGFGYKGIFKGKFDQSQTITCSAKTTVSEGFTFLGGASYGLKSGETKFGLEVGIE